MPDELIQQLADLSAKQYLDANSDVEEYIRKELEQWREGDPPYNMKQPKWKIGDNFRTAIFYFNTNNGITKFRDGSEIKAKENRLIHFPLSYQHAATTATEVNFRVVLNIN